MENIINKLLNRIIPIMPSLWKILKSNVQSLSRRKKIFYDLERKFIEMNSMVVPEKDKEELVRKTSEFLRERRILPVILYNLSKLRKMAIRKDLNFIECFDLLHKIKFYNEDTIFNNINTLNNKWRAIIEMHSSIENKIIKKMMEKNVFNGYIYVDINDKKLNKDINRYEAYINYWKKSNS